jgi:hypothetical protein
MNNFHLQLRFIHHLIISSILRLNDVEVKAQSLLSEVISS